MHRSVTIGLTHPLGTGRVRTKGEAPFRGPSTLLPLDHTVGATVGSPIRLARGLASIEVYTEQDITLKAVSALGVPATLARRPREVGGSRASPHSPVSKLKERTAWMEWREGWRRFFIASILYPAPPFPSSRKAKISNLFLEGCLVSIFRIPMHQQEREGGPPRSSPFAYH